MAFRAKSGIDASLPSASGSKNRRFPRSPNKLIHAFQTSVHSARYGLRDSRDTGSAIRDDILASYADFVDPPETALRYSERSRISYRISRRPASLIGFHPDLTTKTRDDFALCFKLIFRTFSNQSLSNLIPSRQTHGQLLRPVSGFRFPTCPKPDPKSCPAAVPQPKKRRRSKPAQLCQVATNAEKAIAASELIDRTSVRKGKSLASRVQCHTKTVGASKSMISN